MWHKFIVSLYDTINIILKIIQYTMMSFALIGVVTTLFVRASDIQYAMVFATGMIIMVIIRRIYRKFKPKSRLYI